MSSGLDLLTDACAGLDHSTRRMFGGVGFFAPNGGMFAGIVTDDEVMLKLSAPVERAALIALGGHPWVYQGKQRPMTMKDWIVVPVRFYDDPELFAAHAAIAHRLVPAKAVATPKRPAAAKTTTKKKTTKKAGPSTRGATKARATVTSKGTPQPRARKSVRKANPRTR